MHGITPGNYTHPKREAAALEWGILPINADEVVCEKRLGGVVKSFAAVCHEYLLVNFALVLDAVVPLCPLWAILIGYDFGRRVSRFDREFGKPAD